MADKAQRDMQNTIKMLSTAHPAETALLGLILQDGRRYIDAAAFVKSEDFGLLRHGQLFAMMGQVYAEGKTPDLISVDTKLRAQGKTNGEFDAEVYYLSQLVASGQGEIEQHAQTVAGMAYRRKLADQALKIEALAVHSDSLDPQALSNEAMNLLLEANGSLVNQSEPASVRQALSEHWDEVEATSGLVGYSGMATGYDDIDRITDGLQKDSVNVLAARPKMGKTALSLCIAVNVAKQIQIEGSNKIVYIWSGEQARRELAMRLIGIETRIPIVAVRRGRRANGMTDAQYTRYVAEAPRVSSLPIFIDDVKGMTLPNLYQRINKMSRRHEIALVVIDYFGLLTPHIQRATDNSMLATMSRFIKTEIAPVSRVLLLSQLNRNLEARQDKRPMMSDLRDTGALEQDADLISFVYRDSVYNPNSEAPNRADIIIAGNRHGGTGIASLYFEGDITRFSDYRSQTVNLGHRS